MRPFCLYDTGKKLSSYWDSPRFACTYFVKKCKISLKQNSLNYKFAIENWQIIIRLNDKIGVKFPLKYSRQVYIQMSFGSALEWPDNEHDGVSNHRRLDYLLNRLFMPGSKKTSKLHVTDLCAGNSPVTGEFPTQRASNAENVSIWWRHRGMAKCGHSSGGSLAPVPLTIFRSNSKFDQILQCSGLK